MSLRISPFSIAEHLFELCEKRKADGLDFILEVV